MTDTADYQKNLNKFTSLDDEEKEDVKNDFFPRKVAALSELARTDDMAYNRGASAKAKKKFGAFEFDKGVKYSQYVKDNSTMLRDKIATIVDRLYKDGLTVHKTKIPLTSDRLRGYQQSVIPKYNDAIKDMTARLVQRVEVLLQERDRLSIEVLKNMLFLAFDSVRRFFYDLTMGSGKSLVITILAIFDKGFYSKLWHPLQAMLLRIGIEDGTAVHTAVKSMCLTRTRFLFVVPSVAQIAEMQKEGFYPDDINTCNLGVLAGLTTDEVQTIADMSYTLLGGVKIDFTKLAESRFVFATHSKITSAINNGSFHPSDFCMVIWDEGDYATDPMKDDWVEKAFDEIQNQRKKQQKEGRTMNWFDALDWAEENDTFVREGVNNIQYFFSRSIHVFATGTVPEWFDGYIRWDGTEIAPTRIDQYTYASQHNEYRLKSMNYIPVWPETVTYADGTVIQSMGPSNAAAVKELLHSEEMIKAELRISIASHKAKCGYWGVPFQMIVFTPAAAKGNKYDPWVRKLERLVQEVLNEKENRNVALDRDMNVIGVYTADREKMDRIDAFRVGNYDILVCDEVGARGLDVVLVNTIDNFHLFDPAERSSVNAAMQRLTRAVRWINASGRLWQRALLGQWSEALAAYCSHFGKSKGRHQTCDIFENRFLETGRVIQVWAESQNVNDGAFTFFNDPEEYQARQLAQEEEAQGAIDEMSEDGVEADDTGNGTEEEEEEEVDEEEEEGEEESDEEEEVTGSSRSAAVPKTQEELEAARAARQAKREEEAAKAKAKREEEAAKAAADAAKRAERAVNRSFAATVGAEISVLEPTACATWQGNHRWLLVTLPKTWTGFNIGVQTNSVESDVNTRNRRWEDAGFTVEAVNQTTRALVKYDDSLAGVRFVVSTTHACGKVEKHYSGGLPVADIRTQLETEWARPVPSQTQIAAPASPEKQKTKDLVDDDDDEEEEEWTYEGLDDLNVGELRSLLKGMRVAKARYEKAPHHKLVAIACKLKGIANERDDCDFCSEGSEESDDESDDDEDSGEEEEEEDDDDDFEVPHVRKSSSRDSGVKDIRSSSGGGGGYGGPPPGGGGFNTMEEEDDEPVAPPKSSNGKQRLGDDEMEEEERTSEFDGTEQYTSTLEPSDTTKLHGLDVFATAMANAAPAFVMQVWSTVQTSSGLGLANTVKQMGAKKPSSKRPAPESFAVPVKPAKKVKVVTEVSEAEAEAYVKHNTDEENRKGKAFAERALEELGRNQMDLEPGTHSDYTRAWKAVRDHEWLFRYRSKQPNVDDHDAMHAEAIKQYNIAFPDLAKKTAGNFASAICTVVSHLVGGYDIRSYIDVL